MIRIITKLFAVTVVLTSSLHVVPVFAGPVAVWVSGTGVDTNPCTASQPCATFQKAIETLGGTVGGQINCLDSPQSVETGFGLFDPISLTIDCAGVFEPNFPNFGALGFTGANQSMKIRNLTISGFSGGYPAIKVTGSGTLIIENCVFENFNAPGAGPALDIEPTGALSLVIKNSQLSNNAAGVLLKPAAGGSVTATFDGVTIAGNAGGGLRADSSNGPITVDISDSAISNNVSNGFNVTSGTGTQNNMVSIARTTITKNGLVGIQTGGSNAAVLLDTTLLDSNTNGATLASNGARILSYGTNRIVGTPGSGFTGSAALQ